MLWFALILYLHLLAVVAVFVFASCLHLGLDRLGHATTIVDAMAAVRRTSHGATGVAWGGAALLLTGICLTRAAYNWTTPWIDLSILGLLALEVVAKLSGARLRCLTLARAARDPLLRASSYLLPLLTLAILLMMIIKPGALAGAFMLFAAVAGGAALGRRRGKLASPDSISA